MSNDFREFMIDRIEVFLVNGNNIHAPNVTPEKVSNRQLWSVPGEASAFIYLSLRNLAVFDFNL